MLSKIQHTQKLFQEKNGANIWIILHQVKVILFQVRKPSNLRMNKMYYYSLKKLVLLYFISIVLFKQK